jgi:hypothetical protein
VCTAASPTEYRGARSNYIAKPMSARASIDLLRQFSDPARKEAVRSEMQVTRGESPWIRPPRYRAWWLPGLVRTEV